jgi:hypothetical protein
VRQGFARRTGLDQMLAQLTENHLIGEQLARIVIDQEDVDRLVCIHAMFRLSRGERALQL